MNTSAGIFRGPVSPRVHGFVDYGTAALLALGPWLFDFSGLPAVLSYLGAAALLVVSLITAYPLSVAKVVPFPIHGLIEAGAGLLFLLAPLLFGFTELTAARNFFLVVGAAVLLLFALTNYVAAEAPRGAAQRRATSVR